MDLGSISDIYKENLKNFFNDERIIKLIYEEQFGKEYYKNNSKKCQDKYEEIMKNTVFVPYITMEHLEDFLVSVSNKSGDEYIKQNYVTECEFLDNTLEYRNNLCKTLEENYNKYGAEYVIQNYAKEYEFLSNAEELKKKLLSIRTKFGQEYIMQNYNKELNLLKKLESEKKKIIKNYSSFMLDELKQFYPKLEQKECDIILKQCKNLNFNDNVSLIQELLPKNKNGFLQKSKQKKIDKCIEKYRSLVEDKVLIETSSYFKHIQNIPHGKYYPNVLEKISQGGQFVYQKIGKKTDKNAKYIFLPVLSYKNKEEYLKAAVHEVMHVSKEIINKNKYISGLLEKNIPSNSNKSDLLIEDKLIRNISHYIKWARFEKKHNLPKSKKLYLTSYGDNSIEEVIHHWQIRKVMSNIKKDGLLDLLKMPYNVETEDGFTIKYEKFDDHIKSFMSQQRNMDIQKINTGELSAKEFRKKVGTTNFDLFSHLANSCIYDNSKNSASGEIAALISNEFDGKEEERKSIREDNIKSSGTECDHKREIAYLEAQLENLEDDFPNSNPQEMERIRQEIDILKKQKDKNVYSEAVEELIEKMNNHSPLKTRLLEKTKAIAALDITNIGKALVQKLNSRLRDTKIR